MKPNKDLKKLENIQKIKEDGKCQIYKIDFKNIEIPN